MANAVKTNMACNQRGLTLVEAMIAVAIVGVLAAIAYPSYRNQVLRTNRTEAKVALEQRALQLEKCFTRYMTYNAGAAPCPTSVPAADGASSNNRYRITISTPAAADTFTLTAIAQGSQANDPQCATMTLNHAGVRAPVACW